MLLFAPPPASPLAAAAFPDHAEARILHYLPPALAVAAASGEAGGPDFLLLRYRGEGSAAAGGLLRLRLVLAELDAATLAAAAAAGWEPREVGFDAARFRLVLRAGIPGEIDQPGDWKSAETAGRELAAPAASLSAHETDLLASLLAGDGRNAVEVEAEMLYRGLVPGLPWLATADAAALRAALAGVLPAAPARADEVAAAFLSLPDPGPLAWRPLAADAGDPSPARDALLAETAARALETPALFAADPAPSPWEPRTYRLLPPPAGGPAAGEPVELAWDLAVPRQEARRHALSWSITGLLQGLDDEARRRVFPAVPDDSPFAAVEVHVVNQLPLDPAYLKKLAVDVRTPGPAGVPETHSFVFAPGGGSVARFASFRPASGPFALDVRLTATLAAVGGSGGAGWPRVLSRDWAPGAGEPIVTVDRRAAGIDFVRVEAEPEVFARAAGVDVAILAEQTADAATAAPLASLTLTAARPAAWVALPGIDPAAPLAARAVAHPPADTTAEPLVLFAGPLAERALRVAAWQLEVLAPERVSIVLPAEAAARFPYVAVTVNAADGAPETVHTLDPGLPWTWSFFRPSVFAPIRFRYRLDYVALDGDGRPLPLARTAWTDASGTILAVAPPLPAAAAAASPAATA